jgi:hypothetical protein
MVESSEDKTTRKMIDYLTKYKWLYQYSIFLDLNDIDTADIKCFAKNWLLEFEDDKFKNYLRKKKGNKDIAMMYMLRKHQNRSYLQSGRSFLQFYITVYSTDRIQGFDKVSNYSDYSLNILDRKVTDKKIETTCSALKNQKLHDLSFLGGKKRYTIINKEKLIPV